MADNTGREREEELFDIIRSPHRLDDLNEADDGSQYLNNTGVMKRYSISTTGVMKS